MSGFKVSQCSNTPEGKQLIDSLDLAYSAQEGKQTTYDWCGCGISIAVIIIIVVAALIVIGVVIFFVRKRMIKKKAA